MWNFLSMSYFSKESFFSFYRLNEGRIPDMKKVMKGSFSEEPKIMNMYEIILSILDQKGPTSIPSICQQVNQDPIFMKERDRPVQQRQVKSVISRKKDLFSVHNDMVSLLPERHFISLTAEVGECGNPFLKVKVDFIK